MKRKKYAASLLDSFLVVGFLVIATLGAFCGVRLLVSGVFWLFQ